MFAFFISLFCIFVFFFIFNLFLFFIILFKCLFIYEILFIFQIFLICILYFFVFCLHCLFCNTAITPNIIFYNLTIFVNFVNVRIFVVKINLSHLHLFIQLYFFFITFFLLFFILFYLVFLDLYDFYFLIIYFLYSRFTISINLFVFMCNSISPFILLFFFIFFPSLTLLFFLSIIFSFLSLSSLLLHCPYTPPDHILPLKLSNSSSLSYTPHPHVIIFPRLSVHNISILTLPYHATFTFNIYVFSTIFLSLLRWIPRFRCPFSSLLHFSFLFLILLL